MLICVALCYTPTYAADLPTYCVHNHLPEVLHLKKYLRAGSQAKGSMEAMGSMCSCTAPVGLLCSSRCMMAGPPVSSRYCTQRANLCKSLLLSCRPLFLIRLVMYTLHASDLPTTHISRSLGIRGTWLSTLSPGKYRLCTSPISHPPQTAFLLPGAWDRRETWECEGKATK